MLLTQTLSERLLGELKAYEDPTYFCKHVLGIKQFPIQEELMKLFYLSPQKYRELILIAGRRAGKTELASQFSTYEAFKLICLKDPAKHFGLAKGQEIFIINVASSKEQALDTVFAAISNKIYNSDWFQSQNYKERYNEFRFTECNVTIRSDHSNSSSLVGRTIKCAILDELARFTDRSKKSSAQAVYAAITYSTASFGDQGVVISITSPIYANDFSMQLYHKSKKIPNMLGRLYPTWVMNPNISRKSLQSEFDKNPELAERDFGANPSSELESYYKEKWRIRLEDNIHDDTALYDGKLINTGRENTTYVLAGDPAYKNDAFGLALGHVEIGGNIVIDIIHRFKPQGEGREVSSREVKTLIMDIIKNYNVTLFLTDIWSYTEIIDELKEAGVRVERHTVKKEDHDRLKEKIYTQTIKYPRDEVFFKELESLELIRGKKVDHPREGSKDVADAVANVVYGLTEVGAYQPPIFMQV